MAAASRQPVAVGKYAHTAGKTKTAQQKSGSRAAGIRHRAAVPITRSFYIYMRAKLHDRGTKAHRAIEWGHSVQGPTKNHSDTSPEPLHSVADGCQEDAVGGTEL